MTDLNGNTTPAQDELAAWDKLFNEREALNQYLDGSNDAAYHEPDGKLPAETVRASTTAAMPSTAFSPCRTQGPTK